MRRLPTGIVTFLFTDVEGSTRLLNELGDRYADILAEHRRVLRSVVAHHGGVEVDTQGDAFFVAFASAPAAVAAARDIQASLAEGRVRVRIGLHTGEPLVGDEGYVGIDVHRAARICSSAHGGQIVVSARTRSLLPRQDGLADLGLHRLKDLTEPERLWQVGEGDFPPLRSLNATNLPAQPSPLVGREVELEAVLALIRGGARLVTLTGPGGTGKTRLAVQAAAEVVDDFPDGVFFVALQAVADPDLVLPTIASTIGATGELAEHVDEKRMLLLLDNVEQLLPGIAPPLAELLARCPNLTLLTTSRALVRIAGEREYAVPTLSLDDAVVLFGERAYATEPEEAVAEICHRLDGLPLAIELAAARTRVLPPAKLLIRLERRLPLLTGGRRDAPERQRTLRATIEWSNDLLDEEAARLFARLAVFSGGFPLEAAEDVCGADVDALGSLVDHSLLRAEGERFDMLETIREFALERLEASAEAVELRGRHADWALALAEEAEQALEGPEQAVWFPRLDVELANLRSALAWLADTGRPVRQLRLAASLWRFWLSRGHVDEASRWLTPVADAGDDPNLRAKALRALSWIEMYRGEDARATELTEERLALSRRLGDEEGVVGSLSLLATLAEEAGDVGRARELLEECVTISRSAGAAGYADRHLSNLADFLIGQREYETAIELLREAVPLARARGDAALTALAVGRLGSALLEQGLASEARPLVAEGLAVHRELGDKVGMVQALDQLALVFVAAGEHERAARLLGAADSALEAMGIERGVTGRAAYERATASSRAALGDDRFASSRDAGRALSLEAVADDALDAAARMDDERRVPG